MSCCVPDLLHTLPLSLARECNSDLGVDHWTAVKIILSGIRLCFLDYGGDKEFVVKGYADTSFDTKIQMTLSINLDAY